MSDDSILARVHDLIVRMAGPDRTPDDAGPDTPLGESGYGFDSLDVLEVILACEHEFGVVFETGDELTADTLLSTRRLAEVIGKRMVV